MEVELTKEERFQQFLLESESFSRFIVIEARRQRISEAATFMSIAFLSDLFSVKKPELWADVKECVEQAREKENAT